MARQSPRGRATASRSGFSLVEVTLALGIMAFCMIAILGLLPVGLNTVQNGQEESRATAALGLAATSVRSVRADPSDASGTKYLFPALFSDNVTPKDFKVGDGTQNYMFFVLEDGSIRKAGDNSTPRQALFVQVFPPATRAEPLRVYAAVAWPWKPSDKATSLASDLKDRQGLVDSLVVYALPN